MYRYLDRSLRFAFVAVAAAVVAGPTLPVSAQAQCLTNCGESAVFATAIAQARLFSVDLPTPNALVTNGQMINIGGWTAGSRVDAYVDGPAGVGEGVGSTRVDKPRPDVQRLTGRPDSGFDFSWLPIYLNAGPHTLYVYSLMDGVWTVQTVSVIGEGNVVPVIPPKSTHSE